MPRKMAKLHEELPDLARLMRWDPHPLALEDAPDLGPNELKAQSEAWLVYQRTFWAWEELNRIVRECGSESAPGRSSSR